MILDNLDLRDVEILRILRSTDSTCLRPDAVKSIGDNLGEVQEVAKKLQFLADEVLAVNLQSPPCYRIHASGEKLFWGKQIWINILHLLYIKNLDLKEILKYLGVSESVFNPEFSMLREKRLIQRFDVKKDNKDFHYWGLSPEGRKYVQEEKESLEYVKPPKPQKPGKKGIKKIKELIYLTAAAITILVFFMFILPNILYEPDSPSTIINDEPPLNELKKINSETRITKYPQNNEGFYGLLIEFYVENEPLLGIDASVELSSDYERVLYWFDAPNNPTREFPGSAEFWRDFEHTKSSPKYDIEFASPEIFPWESFYVYFEGRESLEVIDLKFEEYKRN